jgi:hypothetical protein
MAAKTLNKVLPKLFSHTINEPANRIENKMIAEQVKQYAKPVDSTIMRNIFHQLQTQIQTLKRQGVQIIFFEMPMVPALEYSVKQQQIRDLFEQYLPSTNYRYLPKPNYRNYQTGDGIHLKAEDAVKFTCDFTNKLKIIHF